MATCKNALLQRINDLCSWFSGKREMDKVEFRAYPKSSAAPKGDPGTRNMEQRQIVLHFLPANEQPSKAVHSGVCALLRSNAVDGEPGCRAGPARPRRGAEGAPYHPTPPASRAPPRRRSLAQAPVLRLRRRGVGVLKHHGLQGDVDPLHLMAIGAVHGDAERQAMAVRQQHAPCGSERAAIGRVVAHLFLPKEAPWSSPRPSPATPTPGPSGAYVSNPAYQSRSNLAPPAILEARSCPRLERLGCAAALSIGRRWAT